jgi:alpha-mannosidase
LQSDNNNDFFGSLFKVADENIIIEVVTQNNSEDYIILRLYESQNSFTKTIITSCLEILTVYEANLLSEKLCDMESCNNEVNITFNPFEIKTLHIVLNNS